jgi:nicotinamidase/pyrazinamidase
MNTNKTIFWNTDTQVDFMRPEGKLPVQDAQLIEPTLAEITQYAANKGIQVVNTADWHYETDSEISTNPNFATTYPEHCMANTPGAAYVAATQPDTPYIIGRDDASVDQQAIRANRNLLIQKNEFDVFAGNALTEQIVDIIDPEKIVVYGVASNVCVDQAVMGNLERNRKVYVISDAIQHLPHLEEHPTMNLEATMQRWEDAGAKIVDAAYVMRS